MANERWTPTKWREPKTGDTPLYVRFRNGIEPKDPAPASKWIWKDRGWSTDITHVRWG